jgi:hypothetical protein
VKLKTGIVTPRYLEKFQLLWSIVVVKIGGLLLIRLRCEQAKYFKQKIIVWFDK